MCGIAGFVEFSGPRAGQDDLIAMRASIAHRGPDDEGDYFRPGVGLSHVRLSIIDLSAKAHQPMRRGGHILAYNGEIFNYKELRRELIDRGHHFESQSDTEVVLEAYKEWGKEALLRFNGMFAFVIYDEKERRLFLARDKSGIKPLVYYDDGQRLVFASEIKAVERYPYFQKRFSQESLEDYLRFGYTMGRRTIWDRCFRLLPGEYMEVDIRNRSVKTDFYWRYETKPNGRIGFEKTCTDLKSVLSDEFGQSVVSDVPLGVCISGGVDSNILIAILARELNHQFQTYSLSSDEAVFDENEKASAVARYLGVEHKALILRPSECRSFLKDTVRRYDGPIADQNILSFRYIARQARRDGIKVLLSGAGGDELFLGYPGTPLAQQIEPAFRIPRFFRALAPERLFARSGRLYNACRLLKLSDHMSAVVAISGKSFFDDELDRLLSRRAGGVPGQSRFESIFADPALNACSTVEKVLRCDFSCYLPDNCLYIADQSCMLEGVEMRVPLLNNRVIDFAARVPVALHRKNGKLKSVLRALEKQFLPGELTMGRKRGFNPFNKHLWLRDHLKDDLDYYLGEQRIRQYGVFNEEYVRQLLDLHRSGRVNVSSRIWSLLMFQIWAEEHRP